MRLVEITTRSVSEAAASALADASGCDFRCYQGDDATGTLGGGIRADVAACQEYAEVAEKTLVIRVSADPSLPFNSARAPWPPRLEWTNRRL